MYTAFDKNVQCDKPEIQPPILENIPDELKALRQWVTWDYRCRGERWTKIPFDPKTGHHAKSDAPQTWGTFDEAVQHYQAYSIHEGKGSVEGIGFMFAEPYCGIDFDKCRDKVSGELEPWAENYIKQLSTFGEVSPSKTGAKLICKARMPGKKHKKTGLGPEGKAAVEIYATTRYFTITGELLPGSSSEIPSRQAELDAIYHELFPEKSKTEKLKSSATIVEDDEFTLPLEDADILTMACQSKNGDRFRSLFFHGDLSAYDGDYSRADQALCSMLAYWCGPDSEDQIDRLFRESGLYRDKWDRDDYRRGTIEKALDREPDGFHAYNLLEFARLEEQASALIGGWQREPEFAEVVQRVIHRPKPKVDEVTPPSPPRGRRGFLIEELDLLPPATWHIDKHFTHQGFVVLFGPSGNFKSFVALDMALCIATGKPYLGSYEVKQGPVAYIVSEGAFGTRKRIKAWLKRHGMTAPRNLVVIPASFNLQEQDEAVALLEIAETRLGCQPQAVFVDTLTRNFGPGDPNSLKDMQKFCTNLDIIRNTTRGTVVVVHHTGWTEQNRERSASNLRDDADTSIMVKKLHSNDKVVELSCLKQKDFEEFEAYTLQGQSVDLGDHLPDEDRWSLVFNYHGSSSASKSEEREVKKDAELYEVIRHLGSAQDAALDVDTVAAKSGLNARTARRLVEEAYSEQLLVREGSGKRGSPFRYWLGKSGAEWLSKANNRIEGMRLLAGTGAIHDKTACHELTAGVA